LPSRQAAIDLPDALKMMVKPPFKVHTSTLFDSKRKSFVENVSVLIDPNTGTVVSLEERAGVEVTDLGPDDFDLRGKVAMPGFVDAHTHIFLHSYEYVTVGSDLPARR
jgi:imidazolonepropionase-like amidohydrolase